MALYPRQNSSCCMQYCCFKLLVVFSVQYLSAIIQHCALTIQHSYFKMQYSICCMQHCYFKLLVVFSIQYLSAIIQHCALTIQHSYFKMQYSTSIIPHFALTIKHSYLKYHSHATSDFPNCTSVSHFKIIVSTHHSSFAFLMARFHVTFKFHHSTFKFHHSTFKL